MSQVIDAESEFEAVLGVAARARETGVVDQNVQRQAAREKRVCALAYGGEIAQLDRKQLRFAAVGLRANLLEHGLRAFGRSAGDEYMSALPCKLYGRDPPDARVRAGYKRNFSG